MARDPVLRSDSSRSNPWQELPRHNNCFGLKNLTRKVFRITPRIIAAGLAGYYILGYAYVHGWMAQLDQLAMKIIPIVSQKIFNYHMGYVAIGALMPTIQWWEAWAVRVTAASATLACYDLLERVLIYSNKIFAPNGPNTTSLVN